MNKKKCYFLTFSLDPSFDSTQVLESSDVCLNMTKPDWPFKGVKLEKDTDGKYESKYLVVIPGEDMAEPKSVVKYENITTADLQDAKFYRTPKIDLPQTKLQNLKDKYNIKIVRDKAKADYIITSDVFIQSNMRHSYHSIYTWKSVEEVYLPLVRKYLSQEALDKVKAIIKKAKEEDDYINITCQGTWKQLSAYKTDLVIGYSHPLKGAAISYTYFNDYDLYKTYANNNVKVVKNTLMLEFCNEDSVELTINDLKSILSMIKSDNIEDRSMGLELMANCNIEKSFDKIALVFAFNYDFLKDTTNWNSVNVKSLRSRLHNVRPISTHHVYNFSEIVKVLHQEGCLTPFAIKAITDKLCKTALAQVGLTTKESVFDFNPKDLKLKPEYINELPF